MCLKFVYSKCKCGKIYYDGQEKTLCGSSGFEDENDGTKCYNCEDRGFFYYIIDDYLIKCPQCEGLTEFKEGKPQAINVERDIIVELNDGKIPPSHQTLKFFEHVLKDKTI